MNLGKRIKLRLDELGWSRSQLYDRVPDLTPAALSALISRDSRRCELDVQIAKALGVHLAWLNGGVRPKLLTEAPPAANSSSTKGHNISPRARQLISRIEAAESNGSSSPQLLEALESVLNLALPQVTRDGYSGLKDAFKD
jgi:transcriptional regulator with XRE-family HTH domain